MCRKYVGEFRFVGSFIEKYLDMTNILYTFAYEIINQKHMNRYSFKKGYDQVPYNYRKRVKDEIMGALHIKAYVSWYDRLYGRIEPRISEYESIVEIFSKYGVTDIWGWNGKR